LTEIVHSVPFINIIRSLDIIYIIFHFVKCFNKIHHVAMKGTGSSIILFIYHRRGSGGRRGGMVKGKGLQQRQRFTTEVTEGTEKRWVTTTANGKGKGSTRRTRRARRGDGVTATAKFTTEVTEDTEKGWVKGNGYGNGKGFNAEDAEGAEGGWVKATAMGSPWRARRKDVE
jgi:hypothetical protein